jgi:PAS domain S-box-containing protein
VRTFTSIVEGMRLNQFKIGQRLTWSFLLVVVLMMATDLVTLWQFIGLRSQAELVRQVDEESHVVLRVHAEVLMLRGRLDDLATIQDSARFVTEAGNLKADFLAKVEHANQVLRIPHSFVNRDPSMLSTVETIQSALPAQIDALTDLASSGDWSAVRLRLQNNVSHLSALSSSVVEAVDAEVAEERKQAQESIERTEQRMFLLLPLTALCSLLVAAALGTVVTRSIVRPLLQLDAGAQALAQGDFTNRVRLYGDDELSRLGNVFNDASQRLSHLYEVLKSSEERYRSVISSMAEGVVVLGSDGKIIACNRSAERILERSAEELLSLTFTDYDVDTIREDGSIFPPDDRPAGVTLRTGEPQTDVRMGVKKPSGEWCWLSINAQPLFREASEGQPYGVVFTFTDITERRHAEEALRRSEHQFHTIFDHAAIGMVLIDPRGHPLRSNPEFLNIVGYREDELAGRTLDDLTSPEDIALERALFQSVVDGHSNHYHVKKRYIRKDGEIRSARLTVSALRNEKQELQFCVAMVEDITSQELAEGKILQMSNRLLRIQEEEQRRIAREVHDSTSQEITALTLNLGALRVFHDALPKKANKLIAESLLLAKRVAREIRTFSYLLHPPMLTELGLWNALRMFVEEFRERSGVLVTLEIAPEMEGVELTTDQEIALFRFIQEALANVHRHSGSDSAGIYIHFESGCIEAIVQDVGTGIPADVLQAIQKFEGQVGGVGLPGMRERIGYVGGELRIESGEHGTTVAALIPAGNQGSRSSMARGTSS